MYWKKWYQCFLGFSRENITSRCSFPACVRECSLEKGPSALGSGLSLVFGIHNVDPAMGILTTNSTNLLLHVFVYLACNK